MTPQEQKNRLNDIMFHARRCELYDDEHRLYAKMGLGITIYFYGGGNESGQRKVLDVFRKYQENLFIGTERWGDYANDYLCTSVTTSPTGEGEKWKAHG